MEDKEKMTEKEEETMLLIWEHGPCSVKELVKHYPEPRPHINTVSSFVRALEAKGYIEHEQGRYGAFNYFAIKSRTEYRKNAIGKMIGKYFGNYFSLVSHLVKEEKIDADQLRQLLDMVENKNND